MGTAVQVAGKTLVKVVVPPSSSLETVGYTRNGADVTEQPFFLPVPGDENGGDAGPPIDIQWLGEIAHIQLEFTKFDKDVADKLRAFVAGQTAGQPSAPGTLMFQDGKTVRLILANANDPMNFPRVVFQEPIQKNVGTRFTMLVLRATAYKDDNGVLWNTTVT